MLVIGAGIIGVAISLRLRQEGREVLLIDRECVAAGMGASGVPRLTSFQTPVLRYRRTKSRTGFGSPAATPIHSSAMPLRIIKSK